MTRAQTSAEDHRFKVASLSTQIRLIQDPRQIALNRAVHEVVRNPVFARAVARGLRLHELERA